VPNYKTHVSIGAIVTIILLIINSKLQIFQLTNIDYLIIGIVCVIYSQLADIDADISKINKYFVSAVSILIMYSVWKGETLAAIISAGVILSLEWVKHRGITHTLLMGGISSLPLYFINPIYGIVAITCFISHLVADGEFSLLE